MNFSTDKRKKEKSKTTERKYTGWENNDKNKTKEINSLQVLQHIKQHNNIISIIIIITNKEKNIYIHK